MFSYNLPHGGPYDLVYFDTSGTLKFDPPVYEQRYTTTLQIIEDPFWKSHDKTSSFKKIVDFGCGEMRLLQLSRRLEEVEHILEVDIDEAALKTFQYRAVPLVSDHLNSREIPLRIEIFKGSLIDSVENVRNVDVIIALEVIEHLTPDVLEKVPQNIFGFMQPKLVIISTPNRDYNVLFNKLNANGFRIDDHKFEWTRKELKEWATGICNQYPNYSFSTLGVGSAPPDFKKIGHVTQFAIFARNDLLGKDLVTPVNHNIEADNRPEVQYKEIFSVDFPYSKDPRSKDKKIKDEIHAYMERARSVDRFYNREKNIYQVPIKPLFEFAHGIEATEQEALNALKEENFEVENDFIILTLDYIEKNFSCRDDFYEDDEDFLDYERYTAEDDVENTTDEISSCIISNEPEEEECWN